MANNNSGKGGGIGFCGLLCIVFIVLKLCNVIDWSWWWVLAPALIPVAIIILLLILLGIITFLKS